MKLKYNESKHTLNQPMRTSFYWREKKKKTKGLSPKKCYLPGKLAQPIYHPSSNGPDLIYLKNFKRESLKRTDGTMGHPNPTKP